MISIPEIEIHARNLLDIGTRNNYGELENWLEQKQGVSESSPLRIYVDGSPGRELWELTTGRL
jgi:hypothetical protein